MNGAELKIRDILSHAGITPNGENPFDPKIHDERLYARVLSGGSLALGESYMDGWWDAEDLADFFDRLLRSRLERSVGFDFETLWYFATAHVINLQRASRARQVAEAHYDIGNDLYEKMLGPSMVYSCGYWKNAKNLEEAQEAKLDLICRKVGLRSGERILDIGCGFGSFARHAATRYGARVVGITISKEQAQFARDATAGLPVEIFLSDYHDITGTFDRVISVGMFEHVGFRNYRAFMQKVRTLLKDDGLFLLHTIGGNRTVHAADPWFNKYIFPNGMLPSIAQIGRSIERLFVMEDWQNFGPDYDKTLTAWFSNFDVAWPELKEKYGLPAEASAQAGERFYRMWKYYLLSMAGTFRSRRTNQLWQIVLSKSGVPGGYAPVR